MQIKICLGFYPKNNVRQRTALPCITRCQGDDTWVEHVCILMQAHLLKSVNMGLRQNGAPIQGWHIKEKYLYFSLLLPLSTHAASNMTHTKRNSLLRLVFEKECIPFCTKSILTTTQAPLRCSTKVPVLAKGSQKCASATREQKCTISTEIWYISALFLWCNRTQQILLLHCIASKFSKSDPKFFSSLKQRESLTSFMLAYISDMDNPLASDQSVTAKNSLYSYLTGKKSQVCAKVGDREGTSLCTTRKEAT